MQRWFEKSSGSAVHMPLGETIREHVVCVRFWNALVSEFRNAPRVFHLDVFARVDFLFILVGLAQFWSFFHSTFFWDLDLFSSIFLAKVRDFGQFRQPLSGRPLIPSQDYSRSFLLPKKCLVLQSQCTKQQ